MPEKELNSMLKQLTKRRAELDKIPYNDLRYDTLEEEIHRLEDEFIRRYGNYIEQVITEVHNQYCHESTGVLIPTAYVARSYYKQGDPVAVDDNEGIDVKLKSGHQVGKLLLVPNPTRLILTSSNQKQEVVWQES